MKDLKSKIYLFLFGFLALILLVFAAGSLKAQNTLTADNNFNAPTGPNMFTTIQAAVNAASDGDIVQVQPSPNTYGSVSIDRQITLMGIGFNVDKDIPLISSMGNIYLTNNADGTSDADGTIIKGLNVARIYLANNTGPAFTLQNILIENCQITYLFSSNSGYSPIDGLEIRDCYITSNSSNIGIWFYMPTTNVIIRNNLIFYNIAFLSGTPGSNLISNNILYGRIRVSASGVNTTIQNNNFIGATGTESAFDTKLINSTVRSNIFYGSTPSIAIGGTTSPDFQNNTFSNNLVYLTGDNTMPPAGNNDGGGNLTGSPEFVNSQLLNTWSGSYNFNLQGGSPAMDNGYDGTDIGITGYILYAWNDPNMVMDTTPVPVIKSLNTSTVINEADNLSTRIIINSN